MEPLIRNKLVSTRYALKRRNEKYVVLTQRGLDIVQPGYSIYRVGPATNKERAKIVIDNNEIYIRARQAGIEEERLIDRQAALKKLQLLPQRSLLAWMLHGDSGDYLLYHRRERLRQVTLESVGRAAGLVKGHVVVYNDSRLLSRDTRFYSTKSVPRHFHMLTYEDIAILRMLAYESESPVHKMVEYMKVLAPGGRLIRLSDDAPFEYAWDHPRQRGILAELLTADLGTLNALRTTNYEYLKSVYGATIVVVFINGEDNMNNWIKRFIEPREWLWVVRVDLPPEQSVYYWDEQYGFRRYKRENLA